MGNALRKRLNKLEQRKASFNDRKNQKRGTSGFKMPGSMNLHKQFGNKKG